MYQINKNINDITKLKERKFSDLGFKERDNLQEWIAKNPDILNEDLLIIQKEFNGFNDTNERLDLLALDKYGNLVIIENKLDDTGKDAVWQVLKYTSYCSTLTKSQIIILYQEYLDKYFTGKDAKSSLIEFLEIEDNEMILNSNDQRIILIANNYRKEVTSTVLWLLKHDVQIQCFRATPFSLNEDLFLQIEQIIPLPETKQYMIDASKKEKEEKVEKSKAVLETNTMLLEFWSSLKENFIENNIHFFDNITPKSWFNMGFWKNQGLFGMALGKYAPRVELLFPNDEDKKLFDEMYKYKNQLEKKFPKGITWDRLDGKIRSRIKYEMPIEEFNKSIGDWKDKDSWQTRIDWFRENMVEFYNAVYPIWEKVNKETK